MDTGGIVTPADMDRMTPQQRADVIDAAVQHSWDDVDDDFRDKALAEARKLNARLRSG